MLLRQWTCLEHGFKLITADLETEHEPGPDDECNPWLDYYAPEPRNACRFTPPGLIDTDNLPAPGTPEYDRSLEGVALRVAEAIRRKGFGH